jgi:hypothetical protein
MALVARQRGVLPRVAPLLPGRSLEGATFLGVMCERIAIPSHQTHCADICTTAPSTPRHAQVELLDLHRVFKNVYCATTLSLEGIVSRQLLVAEQLC